MSITVQIPSILSAYCGGEIEFSLAATSVQEALEQIQENHPDLYVSVCDETGSLRPHINVFVNSSLVVDDKEFEMTLATGDVLSIFQAVSGG